MTHVYKKISWLKILKWRWDRGRVAKTFNLSTYQKSRQYVFLVKACYDHKFVIAVIVYDHGLVNTCTEQSL